MPLLAMVSILGSQGGTDSGSALREIATAVVAVGAMIMAGRYLLTPMFQIIARTGAREVMIAAALFVVIGAAMAMQAAGLSMAMGAFLSGVMLAESPIATSWKRISSLPRHSSGAVLHGRRPVDRAGRDP